jgi:hypothetical protein
MGEAMVTLGRWADDLALRKAKCHTPGPPHLT